MHELEQFDQRLTKSIPYRFRYEVESALRAFHQSHVMLDVYSQGLQHAISSNGFFRDLQPIVVAFGSFGRLDGATHVSDYDVMFIYDGDRDLPKIQKARKLIREIVKSNQALTFDHRSAIENETFDFDKSKAYPILSTSELIRPDGDDSLEIRSLQILTEGRCLTGLSRFATLAHDLLKHFGYATGVYANNTAKFREALLRSKIAYCQNVMGRLSSSTEGLTNRKLLKLFALREFSYLANLFALAEVALAVSAHASTADDTIKVLSAPSIVKIASLADVECPLAKLLTIVSPLLKQHAARIAEDAVKNLPAGAGGMLYGSPSEADEDRLTVNLRILALNVLGNFNHLLGLLHNREFLQMIDGYQPDVTTWLFSNHFKKVIESREALIEACRILASVIFAICGKVCQSTKCPALDQVQRILTEIQQYKIELQIGGAA